MIKDARIEIRIDSETKGLLQVIATELTESGTITELLMNQIEILVDKSNEKK